MEVLRLIGGGYSNRKIASNHTIKCAFNKETIYL